MSRQELEHLHVAAQQAQCVGAGMDLSVCVLVAEGVDDIHHDGRWVRHSVGLSVCWFTNFVSLHCAVKKSQIITQQVNKLSLLKLPEFFLLSYTQYSMQTILNAYINSSQ